VALYAAYASNLHPEQMVRRAPHSPLRGTGWLRGWRLTFGGEERGWDGALATVVEDPDRAVYVAVYDLTDADEKRLDEWEGEGLGLYRKVRVRVDLLTGEVLAWVYVLDAYEGGLPSAHYLGVLADAAEAAGAPDDYVAAVRAMPCRSVGGARDA
jgi:gamma-glutamylcyclotransferase (GGCT)/AIG2-like uncharacterized protein YtfP